MFTKKLAAMLVAAVMIFSAATPAFAKIIIHKDFADRVITKNGKTYIQYEGVKYFNAKEFSSPFYKSFDRQVTKIYALRGLAESLIDAKGNLSKIMGYGNVLSDEIKVEINDTHPIIAIISKEARQFGNVKFEDESCRVIMEIEVEIQK